MKNSTIILSGLVVIFVATTIVFWTQSRNPEDSIQEDTAAIINSVSELIVLPEDEEPTIATVSDAELLSDQTFLRTQKRALRC